MHCPLHCRWHAGDDPCWREIKTHRQITYHNRPVNILWIRAFQPVNGEVLMQVLLIHMPNFGDWQRCS
jgi:hypothetical protein